MTVQTNTMPKTILKLANIRLKSLEAYLDKHNLDPELKGLFNEFKLEQYRNVLFVERKTDTRIVFKKEKSNF